MAKCDLCGESCQASDLANLRECFHVAGVKDVCQKCSKWADDQLWKIRAANAPEMRRRICERAGAQPPKKSIWRRLFRVPHPRPAWGEF